jgi:hypothetical protein
MNARIAAGLAVLAAAFGTPTARAQITVSLHPGDFTYQFADPATGQPISSLDVAKVGDTSRVAVYLLQTGGTPSNLLQQLGIDALGVRLIYSSPTGVVQVPPGIAGTNNTINPNIIGNPNFGFYQKGGSTASPPSGPAANTTNDTSTNAQISEHVSGLPVAFPGTEDPLANPRRMYIATFVLQGLADGTESVIAADPFDLGTQMLTGPNPTTDINDGFHGNVSLDPYLSQDVGGQNLGTYPTITVTVGSSVPEPGSFALFGSAIAGMLAWRRRSSRRGGATEI